MFLPRGERLPRPPLQLQKDDVAGVFPETGVDGRPRGRAIAGPQLRVGEQGHQMQILRRRSESDAMRDARATKSASLTTSRPY